MAQVTVEAEVTHHFSRGVRVKESGEYGNRFSLWTDERPPIGTTVKVSGKLGAKTREHEGKHYVDLSVNFPVIESAADQQAGKSPEIAADSRTEWIQPQTGGYQSAGVDTFGGADDGSLPF